MSTAGMQTPNAFLLTFRTYASQLPGDDRGWCHHTRGMQPPNEGLYAHSLSLLRGPIVALDDQAREIVLRAMLEVGEHHAWPLRAAHVRTQHVHVVASGPEPMKMIGAYKSWSTRCLRAAQHPIGDGPVWARGGSVVPLWSEQEVADAARYAHERQGEAMARWP